MKYVVITTIHSPTRAVKQIAERADLKLVVVGDEKTPEDWQHDGVEYLSVSNQRQMSFRLAQWLPYSHYSRKMLGYLQAIREGAEVIIDTDDDNIPRKNWNFPEFSDAYEVIQTEARFLNIYRYFCRQRIWPRGYPLEDILDSFEDHWETLPPAQQEVGIWQGLVDDDPDVDAIYRLTVGESCRFEKKPPVAVRVGNCVPYNSQNTAHRKELFPLLYLPAGVTFRFTDILRGLVAQPYMWENGYALGFCAADVYQERNIHSLIKDFESEIPCYLHPCRVIELCLAEAKQAGPDVGDYLIRAYGALIQEGLVPAAELHGIRIWLDDLAAAGRS